MIPLWISKAKCRSQFAIDWISDKRLGAGPDNEIIVIDKLCEVALKSMISYVYLRRS